MAERCGKRRVFRRGRVHRAGAEVNRPTWWRAVLATLAEAHSAVSGLGRFDRLEPATGAEVFRDWPENLPRADLVRLLREYAGACREVEQTIGGALPADQRLVLYDAPTMAEKAVAEIAALREQVANLERQGAERPETGHVVLNPLSDQDVASLTAALARTACCPPDGVMVAEALETMAPYPAPTTTTDGWDRDGC